MNRVARFIKNTKGSFAILFVILTFIGVLVATAFIDILKESWTLQEVQSIMDTSGVSALRAGIDEQKLRIEEFEINEFAVKTTFMNLTQQLFANSKNIYHVTYLPIEVEVFKDNWGIGGVNKQHWQALLDSTIIIQVDGSPVFDLFPNLKKTFYDSRDGRDFDVTYKGTTQDGKIELAVRSVSRIVYR